MTDNIKQHLYSRVIQKPGLAYRLPGKDYLVTGEITETLLFNYSMFDQIPCQSQKGFVMVPFDNEEEKAWWFTYHEHVEPYQFKIGEADKNTTGQTEFSTSGFNEYSIQFQKMMEQLESNTLNKVILSRIITENNNLIPLLPELFINLCNAYRNAFVYIINTPETGIWMGASPEILLNKSNGFISTVALAGTRQNIDSEFDNWSGKEHEEQQMVSNYIDKILQEHKITRYQKTGPDVIKAGNINHLKTNYIFAAEELEKNKGKFIKQLHPTPAVCGEPKLSALELIRCTETHQRSYYGGFIGPVNHKEINLFVNIRCMKVKKEHSAIFVGGGLTRQSKLQNEWDETVLKGHTLLSIIRSL